MNANASETADFLRSRRAAVTPELDGIALPAVVRITYGDYVTANPLGRALYAPLFESPEQPANSLRFAFLDPAARDFYVDWEQIASGSGLCVNVYTAEPGSASQQALDLLASWIATPPAQVPLAK